MSENLATPGIGYDFLCLFHLFEFSTSSPLIPLVLVRMIKALYSGMALSALQPFVALVPATDGYV